MSNESTTKESPLTERIASLPTLPGVYLMKDRDGAVIYIGKAKNLRSRVRNYLTGDGRFNVSFLMRRANTIDTVITEDERQALILENDLIKKHHPRYNIRLKDDKAHLIVRIDANQPYPRIDLVRRTQNDGATYIGPFAFSYELHEMLEVIRNILPLRTCSDRVMMNRVRPCLEYQMKRCVAPCCIEVDRAKYLGWVEQAVAILNGKNNEALELLELEMQRRSEELRFEEAAAIRDRIEILQRSRVEKPVITFSEGAKDAFGIYRDESNVEFSVLSVRRGRLFSARTFGFSDAAVPDEELLSSFMRQFYEGEKEIAEEIIVPFDFEDRPILEEMYSAREDRAITFVIPKRGDRMRLLQLAQQNAQENFAARFGGPGGADAVLRALKTELGLEEIPRTIECVDISHFQGGQTVASLVFFQDGQPDKNRYRRFHLSQEGKPDDFASMRETVGRHLSRCAEENTVVDLMIIDGGKAQLAQALQVRAELGLTRPMMVGLAKKRNIDLPYLAIAGKRGKRAYKPERVYVEEAKMPVVLPESSRALHLLERIRDEAHRFAIGFHRGVRARKTFQSVLDEIPGIGERRRKLLLRQFRGLQGIREATPEAIMETIKSSRALAERILERLNRKKEM